MIWVLRTVAAQKEIAEEAAERQPLRQSTGGMLMSENSVISWLDGQMKHASGIDGRASEFFRALFADMTARSLNVLVVGEVGAGKSSTINALLSHVAAPVGLGAGSETREITGYSLGGITLWDTPGFGAGRQQDQDNARVVSDKMREVAPDGDQLIDLVLLVVDGGNKNMNAVLDILDIVTPHLGDRPEERLIVAVNKADEVAHALDLDAAWDWGTGHDYGGSGPSAAKGSAKKTDDSANAIRKALRDRSEAVKARIMENCAIDVEPFSYSAGPTVLGQPPKCPYNAVELFRRIAAHNMADDRPAVRSRMRCSAKDKIKGDG